MNDPRITSYALGELEGPAREEFERDLAASDDLQKQLNETVNLATNLGALPMPTEQLEPETRSALLEKCAKNQASRRKGNILRLIVPLGLAAAAAVTILAIVSQREERAAGVASADRKAAEQATYLDATTVASGEHVLASAKPADELAARKSLLAPKSEAEAAAQAAPTMVAPAAATAASAAAGAPVLADGAMLGSEFRTDQALDHDSESLGKVASAAPAEAPARQQAQNAAVGGAVSTRSRSTALASGTLAGANTYTGTAVVAGAGQLGVAAGYAFADASGAKDQRLYLESRPPGMDASLKQELGEIAKSKEAQDNIRARSADWNTEGYNAIKENPFLDAKQNPLSTFSIDVDTASYANVRRFLRDGTMPPAGAIRTEELINYFTYNYPQPKDAVPFSVNLEVATAPWDAKRELVRIGLKGKETPASERVPANLVFLVDVSGSMNEPNKLPLLQRSLRGLVENLSDNDRVAIVVYAGSSGLVLPSTPGTKKQDILAALDNLQAGGSTHGSEGIKLAYETARQNFRKEGTNRVILCTDGDFNVGVTDQSELQKLIEKERASGVFLSVLGFGTGNVKDSTMELLADKGNGNYAYIDTPNEGRKVLVEQMGATLFTIAKDVKIQVEFNPARVAGYRLVGYENRLLAKEDFNDDKKDAGEIGAGHTVTALYEVIPAGEKVPGDTSVDPLKYQKPEPVAGASASGDLLTVKLRYKQPDGDKSQLIEVPLPSPEKVAAFDAASTDFRFASAVGAFAMKLRGSPDAGNMSWDEILKIARGSLGDDPGSYRAEFLTLVENAKRLAPATKANDEKSKD